jgi:predicted transcriptional regulator
MNSPTSNNTEKTDKKFTPKRRAPYLLQNEVIEQKSNEKKINDQLVVNKESISSLIGSQDIDFHSKVAKLYGLQKKIVHFFVKKCISRESTSTGPITADSLCELCKTTPKTIKKIVARLSDDGLIKRLGGKRGKGGFSTFSLEQQLINVVKLQTELENNYKSLSSRHITPEYIENDLPAEWDNISFHAVQEIGFSKAQIRMLYANQKNTPEVIQESINHFAYTMKNKPEKLEKYDSKMAVLISTLNKGGSWYEPDYISPQEQALKDALERRKEEKARIEAMEKELFSIEFNEWLERQEPDFLRSLLTGSGGVSMNDSMKRGQYIQYFKDQVWQGVRS